MLFRSIGVHYDDRPDLVPADVAETLVIWTPAIHELQELDFVREIKKTKRSLIIETRFSTADPLVAEKLSEYYTLESEEVNAQIKKHIQDFDLE